MHLVYFFARGLYEKYKNDKENFVDEYEKLLSITGKNNLEDITKTMGIDITKRILEIFIKNN